jgi:hypothetical protein
VAEKPLPQLVEDCPFVNVPPHAPIEPGKEEPRKLVGFVLKVTVDVEAPTETVWPFITTETAPGTGPDVKAVHEAATQLLPLYH